MSFDRFAEERRRFKAWTTEQRDRLLATGIPMAAWDTLDHWAYFLDHGALTYAIDPTEFSLEMLSRDQAAALLDLLERGGQQERSACILAELRARVLSLRG